MIRKSQRKPTVEPKRMPVPAYLRAEYGDRLISRAVTAFILGISKSELIRREKDRIYPCITDDKGCVWYVEDEIRKIAGAYGPSLKAIRDKDERGVNKVSGGSKPGAVASAIYSGTTASIVFRELSKGKALEEIVIECEVHPEAALSIAEAYARVKAGVLLTRANLDEIGRMPIRGAWPPKAAEDFLVVLKASLNGGKCVRCVQRPARLCGACASTHASSSSSSNGDASGSTRP